MKASIYGAVLLSLLVSTSCHPTQTEVMTPMPVKPVVHNWTNIDSLIGLTGHSSYGVYADSLGIVFTTEDGFSFLKKGTSRPQIFSYVDYSSYDSSRNVFKATFYKGIAYVIANNKTIVGIPYGQLNKAPVFLHLTDFDLPAAASDRIEFSIDYFPVIINSNGQMLVRLDDGKAPEYVYTVQLDTATGRPVRTASASTLGKQLLFGGTASDNVTYHGFYAVGDKFFVGRFNDLQRITPVGGVETVFANAYPENVISFNGALYFPAGVPYTGNVMYKSVDDGRGWTKLYSLPDNAYFNYSSDFYTVNNRLIVSRFHRELQELTIETGSLKEISLAGTTPPLYTPKTYITGLAEYEGKVYLATSAGGVYTKEISYF